MPSSVKSAAAPSGSFSSQMRLYASSHVASAAVLVLIVLQSPEPAVKRQHPTAPGARPERGGKPSAGLGLARAFRVELAGVRLDDHAAPWQLVDRVHPREVIARADRLNRPLGAEPPLGCRVLG